MPTYCFIDKKTKRIHEWVLKTSEYDSFKLTHPNLERYHSSAPAVSYNGRTFGGIDSQTSDGFKEVLAKIGESHPNSPVGQKYRKNKTIKEVRTQEVLAKYAKRATKDALDKR